jgi:hypothetical protein
MTHIDRGKLHVALLYTSVQIIARRHTLDDRVDDH